MSKTKKPDVPPTNKPKPESAGPIPTTPLELQEFILQPVLKRGGNVYGADPMRVVSVDALAEFAASFPAQLARLNQQQEEEGSDG